MYLNRVPRVQISPSPPYFFFLPRHSPEHNPKAGPSITAGRRRDARPSLLRRSGLDLIRPVRRKHHRPDGSVRHRPAPAQAGTSITPPLAACREAGWQDAPPTPSGPRGSSGNGCSWVSGFPERRVPSGPCLFLSPSPRLPPFLLKPVPPGPSHSSGWPTPEFRPLTLA